MQGLLMQLWKIAAIAANPDKVWQTRRAMKPQPELDAGGLYWNFYSKDGGRIRVAFNTENPEGLVKYARYRIGEVVYIKEAWDYTCYGLDCVYKLGYEPDDIFKTEWHWKSPMFMPAWAARLFLKITGVAAEKLELPLSQEELELEGGVNALQILDKLNGLWVWCYQFVKIARPEAEK